MAQIRAMIVTAPCQDDRGCVADPSVPEFDEEQALDEIKQYLWAGTETTALTLAWTLYKAQES